MHIFCIVFISKESSVLFCYKENTTSATC